MKVHVDWCRKNLLNGEEEIMKGIDALFDDSRLLYAEGNGFHHRISFQDDGLVIERIGKEMQSRLELCSGQRGMAQIDGGYGVMKLETELLSYEYTGVSITCTYRIYSGEDVVTHQILYWKIIR